MKRTDTPIFNEEQKQLISEHILKGAPEFEIQKFIITCERTGLDCFSRQIYAHLQNKNIGSKAIPQWVKTISIITSIDGFRAIAERSGEYRGQTKPEWYYVDQNGVPGWHDVFITPRDRSGNPMVVPDACRVGILREGFKEPCYGVANFASFAKYVKSESEGSYVLDTFWKKMPEHMIAKVAEAQGHRKAFPLLACGLYVEEELGREDDETPTTEPPPESLPPGAKWIEGHSPEDRAAAHSAPSDTPNPEPAADTPTEPQKPAAPPEKKAAKKKAEASTPPKPEEQKPSEAPKENPSPTADGGWQNYVIQMISITKFNGKKLSELTPGDIASLKTGWCDRYADKIKTNPAKVKEAEMIEAAHKHYTAAK